MTPRQLAQLLADRLTRDELNTLVNTIEDQRDALADAIFFRSVRLQSQAHHLMLKFDNLLDSMKSGAA